MVDKDTLVGSTIGRLAIQIYRFPCPIYLWERLLIKVGVQESSPAKYWAMYLYNFLANFRWHEDSLEDHPLIWATAEAASGVLSKQTPESGVQAKRHFQIIPFEFDGRPAFIQPLTNYEGSKRDLLAGKSGGQQTAVVIGEVGERSISQDALNEWLPMDLPEVLALATGNSVAAYSVEFFGEDGSFVQGNNLSTGVPAFLKGRDSIDEQIHRGIGELLTKYLAIQDRRHLRSAISHLVQGGLRGSRLVEDRLSNLFRGFEGLCKAHGLSQQNLKENLDSANRDSVEQILRRSAHEIRVLKGKVRSNGDHRQADMLERIESRVHNAASTDKAFGLQVKELLNRLGLHDAEPAEAYLKVHQLDGHLRSWAAALSYYRGTVVHEGFFDTLGSKHDVKDILDVTTHLHDLLIRIVLKQIGYSGNYQPMTTRFPALESIDWVEPDTEPSRLGYGVH